MWTAPSRSSSRSSLTTRRQPAASLAALCPAVATGSLTVDLWNLICDKLEALKVDDGPDHLYAEVTLEDASPVGQ